jgi:predicted nucleic acid-binding protein
MSLYFMDSSALAKRYMPEKGTAWIREITAPDSTHDILIAQITPVEIISALARHYHDGVIDRPSFQDFQDLVLYHVQHHYKVLALSNEIVLQAVLLHEQYRLRAYDSVQLATALQLRKRIPINNALIFVSADNRLLNTASASGLTTDNPNLY